MGVGDIVPCQSTPPTMLYEVAITVEFPEFCMAFGSLESTRIPQFALNVVLPF